MVKQSPCCRCFNTAIAFAVCFLFGQFAVADQIAPNPNPVANSILVSGQDFNEENFANAGHIEIEAGAEFENRGGFSLTNSGEIRNRGALMVNNSATIFNHNVLGNESLFVNVKQSMSDAVITNFSLMVNIQGAVMDNETLAILNNEAGATIANAGTINNSGVVNNHGTILMNGIINNDGGTFLHTGSLQGTGEFIGHLEHAGTIAPGESTGTMTITGNYEELAGSLLGVEIAGVNDSDQLIVSNDVLLSGGLTVDLLEGFMLGEFQQYPIVDVGGRMSGQFEGLGEGAMVGDFGQPLFITYQGGDGNDVVLFTVPEPSGILYVFFVVGLACMRRQ